MHAERKTGATTIHVHSVGDEALLPQSEFERLLELARQCEEITVQTMEDDIPTLGLMRLAEQSGSFDFWKEEGEDIYSAADGEPAWRAAEFEKRKLCATH